jgi:TatD DNase family protein
MFFDTHAHIDDEQFAVDQAQVIANALANGVTRLVNIGCSRQAALNTLDLIERYDWIYGTVGLHPHDAKDMNESFIQELRQWALHPKIVAIGEIGLDYYYDLSPREVQREVFRQQIRLAMELKMPITIHDRDAHQDVFDILSEEDAWANGGIFHCYSGSGEMAKEIVKRGFYISFSGSVTFKNANKLAKAACEVPLDRLLIETDCPYLAPVPLRGKRNEPAYVVKTAEALASLRGISLEEMARITWENGNRAYRLEEKNNNHEG